MHSLELNSCTTYIKSTVVKIRTDHFLVINCTKIVKTMSLPAVRSKCIAGLLCELKRECKSTIVLSKCKTNSTSNHHHLFMSDMA